MKKPKKVYCIFYLDSKYYKTINQELQAKGFTGVKAIVPTIKLLNKKPRNKDDYREIPILFNYGFIKMNTELAYSREFLNKLKKNISGIRGWLKDTKTLHPRKKKARIDNADIFDDFSIVAMATRKEVRHFQRLSRENKRFSIDNLVTIKPGDYLVLSSYPYSGIDANVLDVNYTAQTVKLLLYPQNGKMEITLPFDSVIYSVYENYDPYKGNHMDIDMSSITEDAINRVLDLKQY